MEVCLIKHKWDCLANPEDDEAQTDDAQPSKEEELDNMRLQQLADELAAESRMTFDDKTNTMHLNRKKVTDFRRNSRVVLPRAQSGIKESNLEVLRRELDQSHTHWMKAHCSCNGTRS